MRFRPRWLLTHSRGSGRRRTCATRRTLAVGPVLPTHDTFDHEAIWRRTRKMRHRACVSSSSPAGAPARAGTYADLRVPMPTASRSPPLSGRVRAPGSLSKHSGPHDHFLGGVRVEQGALQIGTNHEIASVSGCASIFLQQKSGSQLENLPRYEKGLDFSCHLSANCSKCSPPFTMQILIAGLDVTVQYLS